MRRCGSGLRRILRRRDSGHISALRSGAPNEGITHEASTKGSHEVVESCFAHAGAGVAHAVQGFVMILSAGSRRRGARLSGCPPQRPSPTAPPLCRYAERPIDLIRVDVRGDHPVKTIGVGDNGAKPFSNSLCTLVATIYIAIYAIDTRPGCLFSRNSSAEQSKAAQNHKIFRSED